MELRTDRFVPILRELRDLLLEYDDVEHATIIADLLDVAQLGRPEFVTRVQSGEIWGAAAGTIVDLGGFHADDYHSRTQAENAFRRLSLLLVQLADEMRVQGIDTRRSTSEAAIMRESLAADGVDVPPPPESPPAS
jgi:hypothetical protein